MEKLRCVVERITYQNEQNGYSVMSFVAAWFLSWLKRVWTGAGQSQEVIEGITALIAVGVLFYVSNWMISKAEAASWSRYIDGKVQTSVETGSSFALAFTAFLSVFREGAEVVLFYQPMLNEGNAAMVWAGFGAGCVLLVFVYLAITKLSIRLPIKVFFTATSILMAVMCVSFLGSGIKELAEGNVFDLKLNVPGIPENDTIALKDGLYNITLSIKSPGENGYLLHVDDETGVEAKEFWTEPLTATWTEWEFVKQW